MGIANFVIGVFDACHVGHINLLQEYSPCVVGICSDDLVEATKGTRPLYNQHERAALLKSHPAVIDVIIYESLDLSPWLHTLAPFRFIVPPDYGVPFGIPADEAAARQASIDTANKLGMVIKRAPRTEGISTSDIVARALLREAKPKPDARASALAADFHDTFTYNSAFFKTLFKGWNGPSYILTGDSDAVTVRRALYEEYDMVEGRDYNELLVCSEKKYDATDPEHYEIVKDIKKRHILEKNIAFYFDDNPIYCEYLRNFTCVFSVSLNDAYIRDFKEVQKHSNVNFQHHVNAFIREDKSRWVAADFWKSCDAYPPFPHTKRRRQYEVNYVLSKLSHAANTYTYDTLMDVGCGDGALLRCLENLIDIKTIYALDLSPGLMKGVPSRPNIIKRLFDMNVIESHASVIPNGTRIDILIFGGVINYCFDDDVLLSLLSQFTKATHVFIRAVCTLKATDELVITKSNDLNKNYSSRYRTVDNTQKLIARAGLHIQEVTRLYPDEIESKYDTRQYAFYCCSAEPTAAE